MRNSKVDQVDLGARKAEVNSQDIQKGIQVKAVMLQVLSDLPDRVASFPCSSSTQDRQAWLLEADRNETGWCSCGLPFNHAKEAF